MPTLYPPEYPLRPDAPLLAFGPAFAEAVCRFLLHAVLPAGLENQHERQVLAAAALTMLEAFHPRDHLECMMAVQGVAAFAAMMECHRRINLADTTEAVAIKLRANITQLSRAFSTVQHDLERRHAKPLPARPPEAVSTPLTPPARTPAGETDIPPGGPETPVAETETVLTETRPDGTPASLSAYAPEPPEPPYVPGEPPIMLALATRPKPWRMVNAPKEEATAAPSSPSPPASSASLGAFSPGVFSPGAFSPGAFSLGTGATPEPATGKPDPAPPAGARLRGGPLDWKERLFTGDALARFAAARFDPDAPVPPLVIEEEGAMVELRRVDPGGAEEPPIVIRYGRETPPGAETGDEPDDGPGNKSGHGNGL